VIAALANGIVGAVKTGHRHKTLLSALALLVTLLVGVTYVLRRCAGTRWPRSTGSLSNFPRPVG